MSTWTRGRSRRRRALFVCSPIGLGHAQRDVAIARELRQLHPDLEIDWLAQHPVTAVLEAEGERVHPMSTELANESHHIESESAEHDLHCFQAWRRMDEILLSNFMVFHDVVREESYDLWIGDEAWELDYYLHENPEEKRAAYVWLTDFVGWLPMPDGGEREAFLTADYNAEMIEHIARFPRIRDRALYVGNHDDVVADAFGPDLPLIRDWTEQHFDFAGYVSGFDPEAFADREKLRAELGYRPGEQVCIVTVGGSGVGGHLLRRVVDAFPEAKELVPELRMVVVAGPRIDPAAFPEIDGLEAHAYVHNLYRHLAACDLAVVQGGLTTSMELTANRRPFLYFPLRHHFEQNFHVRHRLDRYGAGRAMDFETATLRRDRAGDRRGDRQGGRLPAGRERRRGEGGRADRGAPLGPGVGRGEARFADDVAVDGLEHVVSARPSLEAGLRVDGEQPEDVVVGFAFGRTGAAVADSAHVVLSLAEALDLPALGDSLGQGGLAGLDAVGEPVRERAARRIRILDDQDELGRLGGHVLPGQRRRDVLTVARVPGVDGRALADAFRHERERGGPPPTPRAPRRHPRRLRAGRPPRERGEATARTKRRR